MEERRGTGPAEPVFDLPQPLVVIAAVLLGIHLARDFLPIDLDNQILGLFAFIPDRYLAEVGPAAYPGGAGAAVWSFLSHAALHGSWMHVLFNTVLLVAAGRPVVQRRGAVRFFVLAAAAAAGGAAVHLAVDWGSEVPMIGASGVVFGVFGALLRFAFVPWWQPRPSALGALRVARVRNFIVALVLMNVILVVFGSEPFGGDGGGVAWTAHLGGFLAGYLGFDLLDPPRHGHA